MILVAVSADACRGARGTAYPNCRGVGRGCRTAGVASFPLRVSEAAVGVAEWEEHPLFFWCIICRPPLVPVTACPSDCIPLGLPHEEAMAEWADCSAPPPPRAGVWLRLDRNQPALPSAAPPLGRLGSGGSARPNRRPALRSDAAGWGGGERRGRGFSARARVRGVCWGELEIELSGFFRCW